jgi:hypothetical protein
MRTAAVLSALLVLVAPGAALAVESPRPTGDPRDAHKPGYFELFGTSFVGDGIRFNNPYRLATPLGSSAESLSRTAAYADLGVAATIGNPLGYRHGVALRWSIALEGVPQIVVTPSYMLWRRWRAWGAYGRLGIPIVASPATTWGLEMGIGGVWFPRGGIGIATELVGDLFYGAGTREVSTPAYPVLSAQAGLLLEYEVLP